MTTGRVARATAADLDAIDEIEAHSFKSPWTREAFAAELSRPHARLDVLRVDDRVVGFCDAWITPASAGARDGELQVLAIAVHPDVRGRGFGRTLLEHALATARAERCQLATLEVRRSNAPAIKLYERAGFAVVHVRAGYYQDDGEDALVMTLAL